MSETPGKEVTLSEVFVIIRNWWRYFLSKWMWFLLVCIVFGLLGIFYAWKQKPVYTAELTFAADNDNTSKLSSYVGLASQFGLDVGGGGGGVFEGDNLMLLLQSRLLVEKTMLSTILTNGRRELLINYYLRVNKLNKDWKEDTALSKIIFRPNQQYGQRARDSVLKKICKGIIDHSLNIDKVDKKMNIIAVRMVDHDELFAKIFVEQLANNAIQYYIDYKIKKTKQNVQILQHQTDSVRSMLSGNIVSVAVANDLNLNPLRQVVRAATQQKQIDVQVNGQLYGELLKQLEFAKINLRRETPLIQIIDTPQFPLEKKKLGRLMMGIIFAVIGGFVTLCYFSVRKLLNDNLHKGSK